MLDWPTQPCTQLYCQGNIKSPGSSYEVNMSDFYMPDPRSSPRFSIVDFASLDVARLYVTLPVVAVLVADMLRNPDRS